ncbi:DUF4190 domain-containing protein [Paenibacillus sp. TH7-28]
MDQHPSDTSYPYASFNNDYPPGQPPMPAKTNGKSIASLVLGILSIVIPYIGFILGIVAIVFSTLAFKELKKTNEQGKGLTVAGLVCGIIGTALYGIILLFLVIVFIAFAATPDLYTNF